PAGLIGASVLSAIEQALTDILAQDAGLPVYGWLGNHRRASFPAYANINRATTDRSPAGCAASARNAVTQGYRGVKIAPFDGVCSDDFAADWTSQRTQIDAGVERVFAIREAIGPEVDLMVDCHWRFDEPTALAVMKELEPVALHWFECPVSEHLSRWDALKRLRAAANERGVLLAGAEMQIGEAGFAPLLTAGLFDVVMPDVKYAGGYSEMLRIAALAHKHGIACSPHNPTGPICNMASMHLMCGSPHFCALEFQVGESSLLFDVVGGVGPKLIDGEFQAPASVAGLGVSLDDAVLAQHPFAPVGAGLDPRLG
ncbi:MAG: mandelate racemase/muconate lactonizing enzyme family protein, partial [Casimicrobiaceae bacterium]